MADKKKKGRRAYLSDYVLDVSGEYVYTGDYYEATAEKGDVQKLFKKVFVLVIGAFALLVGVGCLSTGTTSGAFYVTLPHTAAIILSAFCIYDSWTVMRSKGRLRTHDYETSAQRLKGFSISAGVCAFAAAAGQTGYTVLKGGKATRTADILFLSGCFAAAMLYYRAFTIKKQILWQKCTEKA